MPRRPRHNLHGEASSSTHVSAVADNRETELAEERSRLQIMYQSLKARSVVRPSVLDWSLWVEAKNRGDPYAAPFVDHIRALRLERIARVDTPISKKLLIEFFFTFQWINDESFMIHVNDDEKIITAELCERLFGFRCQRHFSRVRDLDYNKEEFWNSIRTNAEWSPEMGYPLAFVRSDTLYMVHRFFMQGILDREEQMHISDAELYLIWCALYKPGKAEIFPHIWREILDRRSPAALARATPLCLGSFVTIIARHFGWKTPPTDHITQTAPLVFNTRYLHVAENPEPIITILTVPAEPLIPTRRIYSAQYQNDVLDYRRAVEENTLSVQGYRRAIEANTRAVDGYAR
ncbi:hypothetical protein CASFOL_037650 [Castilleja foliolosa]|uniref:Uncharacterized protein n=1 Tax=Castilleja foliolosa TaxID=1961234 RepID=A0ABD3BM60_9LAMI